MRKKTKNILLGIGSLVDIMPADGLNKAITRLHVRDDIASHFGRVGNELKDAFRKLENDVKTTTSKK